MHYKKGIHSDSDRLECSREYHKYPDQCHTRTRHGSVMIPSARDCKYRSDCRLEFSYPQAYP